MEMHVGRNEKASKTECIMSPPPGALTQKSIKGENNSGTYKKTNPRTRATRIRPVVFRTEGIISQKEEEVEKEETLQAKH